MNTGGRSFYILHSTFYILHSIFHILHSTFYILHSPPTSLGGLSKWIGRVTETNRHREGSTKGKVVSMCPNSPISNGENGMATSLSLSLGGLAREAIKVIIFIINGK